MFEERRNQNIVPPTRPPLYSKSNSFRRPPVVPRSRPLDPVPRIPPPKRGISFYKPRGVSLERKHDVSEGGLRRSRSQYYVNAEPQIVEASNMNVLGAHNPDLFDANQNLFDRNAYSHESLLDHEYEYSKFSNEITPSPYIETEKSGSVSRRSAPTESHVDTVDIGRRPLSNIDKLRAQFESPEKQDSDYANIRQRQLEIARIKQLERDKEIRRQQIEARRLQDEIERSALIKREEQMLLLKEKEAKILKQQEEIRKQQEEIQKQQDSRRKQAEIELEIKRRKEKEDIQKKRLEEESKRREEELLKKIREQEQELKRLQAAAKTSHNLVEQEVSFVLGF